MVRKGSTVRVR